MPYIADCRRHHAFADGSERRLSFSLSTFVGLPKKGDKT
jgi:hypothetical protein